MPDREVTSIRELIYYQYAKIIAKSALGPNAKKESYGFIKNRFRELKTGTIHWSDIIREDKQFVQTENACIYCGSTEDLQWEHVVPKSVKICDRCASCEKLLGIHNQVLACPRCNQKKHDKGLYEFFQSENPNDKKFYDRLPSLLEKKYLKTIYSCHECAGTIDGRDLDGDSTLTVLDIDQVLRTGK